MILSSCSPSDLTQDKRPVVDAPEFSVTDLNERFIRSQDFKGKPLIIHFWATWSPHCLQDVTYLVELQQKYAGQVNIIGVCMNEEAIKDVQSFIDRFNIKYPNVLKTTDLMSKFEQVNAIPTTLLIDKNWKIVEHYAGAIPIELFDKRIEKVVSEK
jgi:thiol-disulfide isomerase/thioredoxin